MVSAHAGPLPAPAPQTENLPDDAISDDAMLTSGDRAHRLDVRRPCLFILLLLIVFAGVTVSTPAFEAVFGLSRSGVELVAELVLAILAVGLVTRMRSWRDIGFRSLVNRRDLRFYWVPLFPVLPVLPAMISGIGGIDLGQLSFYVSLAALIGFVEEVFFRGIILRSLASGGLWRAAIVSSVLFGLMHLVNVLNGANLASTLLQVGYATAMGFGLAAVALRTGVIWPLVVVHGLIDLAGFVTVGTTSSAVTTADVLVTVVYVVGFISYGAALLHLRGPGMAIAAASPR